MVYIFVVCKKNIMISLIFSRVTPRVGLQTFKYSYL